MNDRERILAALNYEPYDRLPIVHFGFWSELLDRWAAEGHLTEDELRMSKQGDGSPGDDMLAAKLGFDCNYYTTLSPHSGLHPCFEPKLVEVMPDGTRKVMNSNGVVMLQRDHAGSIPAEVDHILKGRKEWDELFLPRLQFFPERVTGSWVNCGGEMKPFNDGGLDYLKDANRDRHIILHAGSLYGKLRDLMGMENLCFLSVDDEDLLDEMLAVNADLCYKCVEYVLRSGARFQIGHFWEDICFKNGPLVNPRLFAEKVGPHYKRITDLMRSYGIETVSLDCDGCIDALVPVWLENGVNVMFPIEVGTWDASIRPWREQYGREVRGVGGMRKHVLARDYAAVDAEVERLKSLVDLGGFIPCPDHRIADDAKWENVKYYCERMHQVFG